MIHYYGNDRLVAFEADPQVGPLTVGTVWREGEDGKWGWAALPGLGTAASVALGSDYDFVPEGKVEEMQKLAEKTRAERRRKLAT